jgi:hypothetical protein
MRNQAIVILVTLLLAEVILRLFGLTPYRENKYQLESYPEFYLQPDSIFGFALSEGDFEISINEGLQFFAKHRSGQRVVTPLAGTHDDSSRLQDLKPNLIHVHGCSFTYGQGVSQGQEWPSLLQQKLPFSSIHNYAVPGFGTVQSWMMINSVLEEEENLPQTIILAYSAYLHDGRNSMTCLQRRQWSTAFQSNHGEADELLRAARFPYVKDSTLQLAHIEAPSFYRVWPGSKQSAIIALIENAWLKVNHGKADHNHLSTALIKDIDSSCKTKGIRFVLMSITNDELTEKSLEALAEAGIEICSAGLDLSDPRNNLLPFDGHPSAEAHAHYAQVIGELLEATRPPPSPR